jgi:hypothetical protein
MQLVKDRFSNYQFFRRKTTIVLQRDLHVQPTDCQHSGTLSVMFVRIDAFERRTVVHRYQRSNDKRVGGHPRCQTHDKSRCVLLVVALRQTDRSNRRCRRRSSFVERSFTEIVMLHFVNTGNIFIYMFVLKCASSQKQTSSFVLAVENKVEDTLQANVESTSLVANFDVTWQCIARLRINRRSSTNSFVM